MTQLTYSEYASFVILPTGAVHLLEISENLSKGLAQWPHRNGFPTATAHPRLAFESM